MSLTVAEVTSGTTLALEVIQVSVNLLARVGTNDKLA